MQAPSLGFAPDGQQSLNSAPEARQRMEDDNARSMMAALALKAVSDATTKVMIEKKATGRSCLRSIVDGMIMIEMEVAIVF